MSSLARQGRGRAQDTIHAERIAGYDPLAVIDAYARKKEILERGDGPVLLDTITYRFSGHSPSDASSYREKTEVEEWQRVDSLITYREELAQAGVLAADGADALQSDIGARIMRVYKLAI